MVADLVIIGNLRNLSPQLGYVDIRVDRATDLGNPFGITKKKTRDDVWNAYNRYFNKALVFCHDYPDNKPNLDSWIEEGFKIEVKYKYPTYGAIYKRLLYLLGLLKQGKKLRLLCWCSPSRCHAETIQSWLLNEYTEWCNSTQ